MPIKYNIVTKSKYVKVSKNIRPKIRYFKGTKHINYPTEFDISKNLKFRKFIDKKNMCGPVSMCNAISFYILKNEGYVFKPSLFYLQHFVSLLTNKTIEDGCYVTDCIKAITKYGVCSEIQYFDKTVEPSAEDIINGRKNIRNFKYTTVEHNLYCIKKKLCSNNPIIASFDWFVPEDYYLKNEDDDEDEDEYDDGDDEDEDDDDDEEGPCVIKVPKKNDIIYPFGHAILIIGYNDSSRTFRYLDSSGFHDIEYDYILNRKLTDELYVITKL